MVWVVRGVGAENALFRVSLSPDGGSSWVEVGSRTYEVSDGIQLSFPVNTVVFQDTSSAKVKVEMLEGGTVAASAVSGTFAILNTLSPPSPVSPAPSSTVRSLTPSLEWAEARGPLPVTSYTVSVYSSRGDLVWSKTTTSTRVTVERSLQDGWYSWQVEAVDGRGVKVASDRVTFEVYTYAPVILSFTAENEFVASRKVTLFVDAVNVVEVSLSQDGVTWTDWYPYSTSYAFLLPALDGTKQVYCRGRDAGGRMSDVATLTVYLDTTPPVTAASLSGQGGSGGYRGSAVVTLHPVDALSGVKETRYRVDGGEWKTGTQFVVASDGDHAVEYYSLDLAGNAEEVRVQEFTVYTPVKSAPYLLLLACALGLAAGGWAMKAKGVEKIRAWRDAKRLRSEWFRRMIGWDRVLERRRELEEKELRKKEELKKRGRR